MALPDGSHKAAAGRIRNLVELALQHGDAGLGVDARRADVGVPEELLDVGDVHADREQPCCHGVPQKMGVDALPILASCAIPRTTCPILWRE